MRQELARARRLCFDTNAVIYHLHRAEPYSKVVGRLFDEVRDGIREGILSAVTELELLVRPIREKDEYELGQIRALLEGDGMRVVDLDRTIARLAAEVRADSRLDLADAAIVATALATRCDAIVGNDARCAERVRYVPYVFLDALVQGRE